MDAQVLLLLATVVIAMILFSLERIPTDATAIGVLLFLILAGLLPAEEAFAGFGSDVVIMMLGLLILMAALARTGVTDAVSRALARPSGWSPTGLLLVLMTMALGIGAFMSNTAATALLLPVAIGLARDARLSWGKYLMPLAFASMLAGSITLIGTSTNIIVSGLMTRHGLEPMGVVELAPVGLAISVIGIGYMLLVGRRLVPDRIPSDELEGFSKDVYVTEILILPDSQLAGETLDSSNLGRDLDLKVLRVLREGRRQLAVASTELREGDVLLVAGERDRILGVRATSGVAIRPEVKFTLPELEEEELGVTDVIITPGSELIGRTLEGLRFRDQYELQVLAVDRHGRTLSRKLSKVRLRTADVLVVQGPQRRIEVLEREGLFRVLKSVDDRPLQRRRAPIAVAVFLGVLAASAFDVLSLPVAMLLGALVVFATRCITPEEAYKQVDWRVLILIACMLALGAAMEATGTADFLAQQIVSLAGQLNPAWLLVGFFALTSALTQPMSNQAAATVVLPIALDTAVQLGLNPRTFAVTVALAASCSFLTPLEPCCQLVYGPGRYRFLDFVRVGAPLTVLVCLVCTFLVPLLWPIGAPF
jgi:di/tricarboxylate transporter